MSNGKQNSRPVIQEFSMKTNGHGRLVEMDSAGRALLGYSEADMNAGMPGIELIAAKDRQLTAENWERVLKGEWLSLTPCRIVDKAGKAYPALIDAHQNKTKDGLQCTVFLLPAKSRFADLMWEYKSVFSAVLASIPCGLYMVDCRGRIVHWNAAAAVITGLSSMQVIGKSCKEVLNCPNHEQLCPLANAHKGTVMPLCTHMELPVGGRSILLQKTSTYLNDDQGNVICSVESFVDLSLQNETQAALDEARELAESARQAKRHFMANMSHEIRTPINGMLGMLDLALSSDEIPESQRDHLLSAQRSAHLLENLIGDILDFAIVDKGSVDIEQSGFSLSSVISSVITRQYELTRNRSVAIHTHIDDDVPDNIHGDSGRLYQILKHLVGNGIKFTPHGEVSVSVSKVPAVIGARTTNDRNLPLQFTIRDTGVGIPRARLEYIFEAMAQADETSTRTFGGLGIGLSIVHRLVTLLEGRIWMDSVPGKGTTVHFVLPFKSAFNAGGGESAVPDTRNEEKHPRLASIAGFTLVSSETVPPAEAEGFALAPKRLSPEWHRKFETLLSRIHGKRDGVGRLMKELKTEAVNANQSSLATLLFRLLLALRRDDTKAIRHYQQILSQRVESLLREEGPEVLKGGNHESIDRRG